MSEEFGPNFITLTDEDGNDIELEYVDALELDAAHVQAELCDRQMEYVICQKP